MGQSTWGFSPLMHLVQSLWCFCVLMTSKGKNVGGALWYYSGFNGPALVTAVACAKWPKYAVNTMDKVKKLMQKEREEPSCRRLEGEALHGITITVLLCFVLLCAYFGYRCYATPKKRRETQPLTEVIILP